MAAGGRLTLGAAINRSHLLQPLTPGARAAIYCRVSTRYQEPRNQGRALAKLCQAQQWTIAAEYTDRNSGGAAHREQLADMLDAASRHEFDIVVFWSLDRLSREGTLKTLEILQRLANYGVKYRSLTEPYIDASAPFAEAIIGFVATIAKMERERLRERVRAGLDQARARGVKLGRHRRIVDRDEIVKLYRARYSLRRIARKLHVSPATVLRRLRELDAAGKLILTTPPPKEKQRHARLSHRR